MIRVPNIICSLYVLTFNSNDAELSTSYFVVLKSNYVAAGALMKSGEKIIAIILSIIALGIVIGVQILNSEF